MRKSILFFGLPALALAGYALYLAHDAGEFRSVENLHPGECRKMPGVPGAEDITLHPDWEVALISSFDRRAAMDGNVRPGGIFAWALDGSMETPVPTSGRTASRCLSARTDARRCSSSTIPENPCSAHSRRPARRPRRIRSRFSSWTA